MELDNRQIGLVLLAVTIVVAAIAGSYDNALTKIVDEECTHGALCPMHTTIDAQRNLSIALIALLVLASAALFFWTPATTALNHALHPRPKAPPKLEGDEKQVFDFIAQAGGSVYQGDIIDQTGFSKVTVSRILDRLEQAGLTERKRRGMANLVELRR